VGPEAFEVVVITHSILEDVHDDVSVVEERPMPALDAFGRQGFISLLSHAFDDSFADRVDVHIRAAGADDEEVGYLGRLRSTADVEDDEVAGLAVERELGDASDQLDLGLASATARRCREALGFLQNDCTPSGCSGIESMPLDVGGNVNVYQMVDRKVVANAVAYVRRRCRNAVEKLMGKQPMPAPVSVTTDG